MTTTFTPAAQPESGLRNAFEGIAPSASTSAASSSKHYDVFINHRGPDVKYTVASSIYHALNGMGLRVFLDSQELELGDFLPEAIQEAMRTASLHIAIFSKNYAQSAWCLAELAFMLQTGSRIFPVFYHVQPDDLRWAVKGKGIYAHSFFEHELKCRYTSEQLHRWKGSLHNASFYLGDIINNEKDEQRVLKNIVNRVLKEIKKVPLEVAKHPVGLNEAVQGFEKIALQSASRSHENVQIVGIWGMGGSGKTTLAKELYNKKCSAMERSSFLFDLRDAAGKGKLHKKQKRLLEDLGVKAPSFDNVVQGKGILASRLRSLCVFMVLDDVDRIDQLDALLPPTDSLGQGSLIIVTTRESDVLRSCGISAVYKMRALDRDHAKQLFCWHAFLQPSPLCGFDDLVEDFLNACHALPLSLKVLGGQLYGKSGKDYWVSQLSKISRILPSDIQQRLKVSYDVLDEEEKGMFLDSACFFIGENISLAIAAWDGLGWSGLHGWERLANKCLVDLDEDNEIRMHDHLRDLGREIANGQSPYRLWFPRQIIDIQEKKRIRIRGMVNYFNYYDEFLEGKIEVHTSEGVQSLKPSQLGLKFLVGEGFLNQEVLDQLLREIVWFGWSYFQQRSLSSWPSLENLRILELRENSSFQELWEADSDAPLQLRELVIYECPKFQGFPRSIGHLEHLRKISVDPSSSVTSLPEEFCLLKSLEHLELKKCKISSLPSRFGDLTNLRYLDLFDCSALKMLPVSFKQLTLLQYLDLQECSELTITSENLDMMENMTKLEYLNFSCCAELEELPCHIANQTSLKELYLDDTSIRELPANIGQLRKLEILQVRSNLLTSLSTGLGNLSSLRQLFINERSEVESLPDSVCRLSLLEYLSIYDTAVKSLPIIQLINLERLEIMKSPITELIFGTGCCKLKEINLQTTDVSKISISEECLLSLKTLQLVDNHHLMEVESLPTTVENINVDCCAMLKNMRGIYGLVNLQTLIICECPELDALPSLAKLTSLKELDLVKCDKVEKIEGLEYLRSLENLMISGCPELDTLSSFAELTSLKQFQLKGCHKIEKIEGLERLRSLENFIAYVCLKEPCIVSLEQTERLRGLALVANERSVIERWICTIQKWPRDVIICTRASCGVGSLVNSFAFPNVSLLDSIVMAKIGSYGELKLRHKSPSNADSNGSMICLIINCVSPLMDLHISPKMYPGFETELGRGKWVWMGVFIPGDSLWLREGDYEIYDPAVSGNVVNEVEAAWLVTGKEDRLVGAFNHIFHTFTR